MNIFKRLDIPILIPALVGLSAAILQYLSYISPEYCDIICSDLVVGAYSTLFGVPIILLSLIYFSLMISYSIARPVAFIKYFFLISLIASIISFYLLYLLFYVIEYLCIYCIVQNISLNAITIILAINIRRNYRRESPPTFS